MLILRLALQLVASTAAGAAIFWLWRRVAREGSGMRWVTAAGVIGRAVFGQALFWISYLHLPIARPLQIGNGLWFFALDSTYYFDRAVKAANGGIRGILAVPLGDASPFFIKTLAAFVLLFGAVPAVALLLNLASYLGSCAAVLKLAPQASSRNRIVAVAALSLSPSGMLWSSQPLKDVFFLFLVAIFFLSLDQWRKLTADAAGRYSKVALLHNVGMMIIAAFALLAISGIRWYFGFTLVAASVPFLVLAIAAARRRTWAAANAALLFAGLVAGFLGGAGPYVPPSLHLAMTLRSIRAMANSPRTLWTQIETAREGFDRVDAHTKIGVSLSPPVNSSAARFAAAGQKTHDSSGLPIGSPRSGLKVDEALKPAPDTMTPVLDPLPSGKKNVDRAAGAKVAENSPSRRGFLVVATPQRVDARPPVAKEPEESSSRDGFTLPQSRTARIFVGTAAVILPRIVAEALGFLHVAGGRGLWFFAEVDTIAFDCVLVYALLAVLQSIGRRRVIASPTLWLVGLVTLMIGGMLAYTVSNFGTLFRHREMIYFGLAVLPLAIAAGSARAEGEAQGPLLVSSPP